MKKLITLLGLVAILAVSGCWIQQKGEEIDEEEGMTEEEVQEILDEVAAEEEMPVDEEFEAEAEAYADIIDDENASASDCESLEDPDLKATCEQKFLYEEAVESGDATKCEELIDEYDQETCAASISE